MPDYFKGSNDSRLTNEALARVFHQGPGNMPNMTGCSTAVLHLLMRQQAAQPRMNYELKKVHVKCC